MTCNHDIDPEYLHPSDCRVLDVTGEPGTVDVALAVPCTECDEAVRLDTRVESKTELDMDTPFGDVEDFYQ